MLGAGLDENGLMKSEGGLAHVRWVFMSVVGAAEGVRTFPARLVHGDTRPVRPGSRVAGQDRYRMHWFCWFHCGL